MSPLLFLRSGVVHPLIPSAFLGSSPPPMDHAGGSRGPGSYAPPQTTLQRSPSGTHHRSPSQQGGKSSGNVNRIQSRQNTEISEISPVLPDPGVHGPNSRFYGQTGGAGMSRTDLRNALGNKNRSKRDVGGQGSRELSVRELVFAVAETCAGLDLNQINLDNMGERSHNRGASSASSFLNPPCFLANVAGGSAVNAGSGHNRGGTSRNPSRAYFHLVSLWRFIISWIGTDLLKNSSRDHLGHYGGSPSDCTWTTEDITASPQRPIRTTKARALLVSIL